MLLPSRAVARPALLAVGLGLALAAMPVPSVAQNAASPNAANQNAESNAPAKNITRQVQNQTAVSLPSLHPIVDRVMPAVVNVSVRMKSDEVAQAQNDEENNDEPPEATPPGAQQGTPFDDLLRRFFGERGLPPGLSPHGPRQGPGEGEAVALGSGFIIDPTGYVVTNNHVVGKADKVTVIFQDNSKHPAKIIGRDEKTDVALLKIDTDEKLPFVQWGDSEAAQVGDWVVAVGNPFGLGGSVTAGIISARGRDINSGPYDDFLQIDAPINRGNSGGPTFNQQGEVVGINTAIYSPNGGSVGIGFAIPSNLAKNIVAQLKEHGSVERGWLGVKVQGVTPAIAKSLGMKPDAPEGALVAEVTQGSPAAKAGLQQGDVITAVDGKPVDKLHDLPRLIAEAGVGKPVDLTIRRNGTEQQLAATLGKQPQSEQVAANDEDGSPAQAADVALGLKLAPLDARARQQLGLPKDAKGVVIADVADDSPLVDTGVRPGDVIVSVNQRPVHKPDQAAQALREAQKDKQVLLLLNRRGEQQFVGLSLGDSHQG
jgi:serine protease Do